jgi:drug/metabolite transporter (DMT)-like permease
MSNRTFALLALFTVQLLYGINFTFAKNIINDGFVSSTALVLLRVAGATALFWLVTAFFPKEKIALKDFITFIFAAFFGVVINMLFFLKGLELTTPINAAAIISITPIIIIILSSFYLKEAITKLKIAGVILAFAGAFILSIYGKSVRIGDNVFVGNLLILINVISYSIYIIMIKKLTVKYHPFTFIKWLFLFGTMMMLPFSFGAVKQVDWSMFTPSAYASLLFVVVGATFGTFLLNPLALRHLRASTVGIFIYLQPVIAAIFAISMGADSIDIIKIISAVLIFSGVYLVTKKPKLQS